MSNNNGNRQTPLTRPASVKREPLRVEGYDGVYVRELTAAELSEFVRMERAGADSLDRAAWLATRVACDADGGRIMGDDDVEAVKQAPARVLTAINDAATRLSGFGGGGDDDASKKNESAS